MKITKDTIEYVAALTKLSVSEEEKENIAIEIDRILDYIEIMNQLDTEGVEPMSHVMPVKNVFREDIIEEACDREQLLQNAPKQQSVYFEVPKTVE